MAQKRLSDKELSELLNESDDEMDEYLSEDSDSNDDPNFMPQGTTSDGEDSSSESEDEDPPTPQAATPMRTPQQVQLDWKTDPQDPPVFNFTERPGLQHPGTATIEGLLGMFFY